MKMVLCAQAPWERMCQRFASAGKLNNYSEQWFRVAEATTVFVNVFRSRVLKNRRHDVDVFVNRLAVEIMALVVPRLCA
jgi:hypothetical protein